MRKKSEYKNKDRYRKLKSESSRRYRQRTGSGQYHSRWSESDLITIMKHEQPDAVISPKIGHSVSAIQAARRRIRLGQTIIPNYDPNIDSLAELSALTNKNIIHKKGK